MIAIRPTDANGYTVTELAQWDTGVVLYFSHDLIDAAYEVHFSNNRSGYAYIVESSYNDGVLTVTIPDALLQTFRPIDGYICTEDASGTKRSLLVFRIVVNRRAQPSDYLSTESSDYTYITESLAEINDFLDNIYTYVSAWLSENSDLVNQIESISQDSTFATDDETGCEYTSLYITMTNGDTYTFKLFRGQQGEQGVGIKKIEFMVEEDGTYSYIVFTLTDGSESKFSFGLRDGEDGEDGEDGVGISSITSTALASTDNSSVTYTITITLTNGTEYPFDFTVYNGEDGADGEEGKSAYDYAVDGGYTGTEEEFAESLAWIASLTNAEEESY